MGGGGDLGLAAVDRLLDGGLRVAPAADVPPVEVAGAAYPEHDQEALGAGRLAGGHLHRVVRPAGRARRRPGVLDLGGLLVAAVPHRPGAEAGRPAGGSGGEVLGQQHGPVRRGHLHVVVADRGVPRAQPDAAADVIDRPDLALERARHHPLAGVRGEQALDVVARRPVRLVVVEPDQVRRPVHVVDVGQQRRVRRQSHDVGVTLQPRHVRGLGQRVEERVAPGGVLAHEHLRPLAVVGVVAAGVGQEPVGVVVVVLVDQVGLLVAGELPHPVEPGPLRRLPRVTDDLDLRVPGPDRVGELGIVREELRIDLLVPEPDVLQPERLRMPELRPLPPPGGADRPVGELDQVQRVAHPSGQPGLVGQRPVLAAPVHAHRQHRQCLGPDVLGELEVLEVADAVALVVAPEVEVRRPLLDRADRLLPLVDAPPVLGGGVRLVRADVRHTAPGKAEEPRLQIGDHLGQVGPHAVPLEGVTGEQRDHVEVGPPGGRPHDQPAGVGAA